MSCTGLNLKSKGIWWQDKNEKYYCNYCKEKYEINNLNEINTINNKIYKYYCSSYLLKPNLQISLFTISFWSFDLNTHYEYDTNLNIINMPTNTEYIIFINSKLSDTQYFNYNCIINNIEYNDENIILYKSTALIMPKLKYIKKLNEDKYNCIKTNDNINIQLFIYNSSELDYNVFRDTFFGSYHIKNIDVILTNSPIKFNIKQNFYSDEQWNPKIIHNKIENIQLLTTIKIDDNINNLDNIKIINDQYLASIKNEQLIKLNFKLKKYLYNKNKNKNIEDENKYYNNIQSKIFLFNNLNN